MADQKSDIARFAVGLIETAHRRLYEATDGLMEEQLYYQPSPETNSIGWLAWHLSRWKDYFCATFTGEEQVWVSQGWAKRFGMDEGRTGLGDTLEQVAAFRVDRKLLFGYVDAAHKEAVARASKLTAEQLEKPFQYMPGTEPRPGWRALIGTVMDFTSHTGQIAYLRGLISGYGWARA